MKSQVHVQVQDSKYKRKLLLESARILTLSLRDYQHLKEIRQIKKRKIQNLKNLIQHMREGINKVELKDIPELKTSLRSAGTTNVEEVAPVRKELHRESDKLTFDLKEIEKKLNSI